MTWYSAIVHKFTRVYPVCSTSELTKQVMEICVKNCAIDLKKNNLYKLCTSYCYRDNLTYAKCENLWQSTHFGSNEEIMNFCFIKNKPVFCIHFLNTIPLNFLSLSTVVKSYLWYSLLVLNSKKGWMHFFLILRIIFF